MQDTQNSGLVPWMNDTISRVCFLCPELSTHSASMVPSRVPHKAPVLPGLRVPACRTHLNGVRDCLRLPWGPI